MTEAATNVAHCWKVTRADGQTYGFTDHDVDMFFDGVVFRANSGLSAAAFSQTTGLSVDNSEVLGALSDAAIREQDLDAGRFDGARVEAWHVDWSDPEQRNLVFRGSLGEITRQGQAFSAELRGLAEALNQPVGRTYTTSCPCVLGDAKCGIDITINGLQAETAVATVEAGRVFTFKGLEGYSPRWFERGKLSFLSGPAKGLSGSIKNDRIKGLVRQVELWAPLGVWPDEEDEVRLTAGCDKRLETCRKKFDNVQNFRGFPDIPGDDWLVAHPSRAWVLDGGSRR